MAKNGRFTEARCPISTLLFVPSDGDQSQENTIEVANGCVAGAGNATCACTPTILAFAHSWHPHRLDVCDIKAVLAHGLR
jgi:hypothetical protein